jgi:glycosyltransferase involved in cell wall biosynthesis
MQYTFPEEAQWGEMYLEHVWNDFAGDREGIIFTIWDASRLLWFVESKEMPQQMQKFLKSGRFKRWGYFPVDATGPNDKLSVLSRTVLEGYDRVLAYGAWGSEVLQRTLDGPVDWLPHGFNAGLFKIKDKKAARIAFGVDKDAVVVGCNMTNQARKDWGTAFMTAKLLQEQDKRFKFWFHTDLMINYWNFYALGQDIGVEALVTTNLSDEQLSYGYSMCDVTMLPSLGEGFGFPIVESLASGVPCVHTRYGGGTELVPYKEWLVEPLAFRLDGLHNSIRPVLNPQEFVKCVNDALKMDMPKREVARNVEHLGYKNLWPSWEKWFREGL